MKTIYTALSISFPVNFSILDMAVLLEACLPVRLSTYTPVWGAAWAMGRGGIEASIEASTIERKVKAEFNGV
ncbi:hypothetical protein E2C01_042421 [Portunus trituberculatus]|uniref:Uncharacterized protein n=1 Tax=Portunus trituberculatus TaxID=210409 RepID=A0A5B7FME2_PORTR|nr:hypothetical protein [Portunus trituberculatus]